MKAKIQILQLKKGNKIIFTRISIIDLTLGYGFVPTYQKGIKGQYQLIVEKSRWLQLKSKLKEVTRKTTPITFGERIQKVKEIHRGWINSFRLASMQDKLKELDGWLRNRLRYCLWFRCTSEEKEGKETEEPYSAWGQPPRRFSLEQKQVRRLGYSPESYPQHYYHGKATRKAWIRIYVYVVSKGYAP